MRSKSRYLDPEFRRDFPWSLYWLLSDARANRLHSLWRHLSMGGWVWPFVYVAGGLLFTQYTANPLMWISFNQKPFVFLGITFGSYHTYDHFWDLILIAGLTFALAAYFVRKGKMKWLAVGVIATWGSWLMWVGHEGFWWVLDVLLNPHFAIYLFGFGELLAFFTVFIFFQFGYVPWRYLLWMGAFYAVWAVFGFHVTVNFSGPTQFYADPGTFAWEIGSWAWGAWGFWHFERQRLFDWYTKVNQILHKRYKLINPSSLNQT